MSPNLQQKGCLPLTNAVTIVFNSQRLTLSDPSFSSFLVVCVCMYVGVCGGGGGVGVWCPCAFPILL